MRALILAMVLVASFAGIVTLSFTLGTVEAGKVAGAPTQDPKEPLSVIDVQASAGSRLKVVSATGKPDGVVSEDGFISRKEYTCLAQAVYFEARSEPIEGQAAVAEVVLNRVRDKRFPNTVCGVVFQNEKWRNRCQFSFACDGRSDRPRERQPWRQAREIAAIVLAGIGGEMTNAATHYHAVYVQPGWARRLKRTVQVGHHVFYR